MVRVWHDTTRTKTSQNFSWEKKSVFACEHEEKREINITRLLERTAQVCVLLPAYPLLFLLLVTVRCLCVIMVFVWVTSHSDLRSGQRALMHMGKSSPSEQTALPLILLRIIPSSTLMFLCLTMKKRDLYFYFPTSTSLKCPSIVPSSDFLGPLYIS